MKLSFKPLVQSFTYPIDKFKTDISLKKDSQPKVSTLFGSILSIFITIVVLWHCAKKFTVLVIA